MSPCARGHLSDGASRTTWHDSALRRPRQFTVLSRRAPTGRDGTTTRSDGDGRGTRGGSSASTLVRGRHVRHIRSGELARRRSRSATPNDHRSATRHSISRTCANCPDQPTDTDGHCPTALTTVRDEPRWPPARRSGDFPAPFVAAGRSKRVPKSIGTAPESTRFVLVVN